MYKNGDLEIEYDDHIPLALIVGGGKIIYIGGVPEIDELIKDLKAARVRIRVKAKREGYIDEKENV